jgi:hypothetical protein
LTVRGRRNDSDRIGQSRIRLLMTTPPVGLPVSEEMLA